MSTIRTFVAVQLPAEIRRRLAEIERSLSASGADVKWVTEANFHVTLKFLGAVDSGRIEAVTRGVQTAVEGLPPFEVSLHGAGAFPNLNRPNVVWVGIGVGAAPMADVAARIESALERVGFPREARKFSAHITLGRARSMRGMEKLKEGLERLREEDAGSFMVESVSVMKSDLRPSGPVYTPLAECRFDGK